MSETSQMLDDAESLALLEARYLGKPQPVPYQKTQEGIAHRRTVAAQQAYAATTESWPPEAVAAARAQLATTMTADTPRGVSVVDVGRNEPCLCGSGGKYKYCCGR